MNKTQLKQRIVGAIVLVALGVIFIPIILNREDAGISGSNIPEMPVELEKLAKRKIPDSPPAPEKPETVRQVVDEKTAPLEAEKKATTEVKQEGKQITKTAKPKVNAATKNNRAWVVQVASFSERKKALALRDRMRKKKFTTFVESVSTNNNVLFRVRVGPVVKKSEAEALQKEIIKQFKLKDALVMSHP